MIAAAAKNFLTSSFTDLSGWKKRLLQLSGLMAVGGGAAWGLAEFGTEGEPAGWTRTLLTAGVGGFAGFLVGALFRAFLKLGLLLALVVAGAAWGLSALGVVELPYESFGELYEATSGWISAQTESVNRFLQGFLPSGLWSGAGLAAGVTQRPTFDDDDD